MASVRDKAEKRLGYRLPDDSWEWLGTQFLDAYREWLSDGYLNDPEGELEEYVVEHAPAYMQGLSKNGSGDSPRPLKKNRKPRRGTKLDAHFRQRYEIYLFAEIERVGKKAEASLLGEEFTVPSWEEVYAKYKAACDIVKKPKTLDEVLAEKPEILGEVLSGANLDPNCNRICPNVAAFKQMYHRVKKTKEFDLTEEARSDLAVQMFLDAIDTLENPRHPKTLCDAYRIIRDKRQKGIVPKWRGLLTGWDIYGMMKTIMDSVIGARCDGVGEQEHSGEDARAKEATNYLKEPDWTADELAQYPDLPERRRTQMAHNAEYRKKHPCFNHKRKQLEFLRNDIEEALDKSLELVLRDSEKPPDEGEGD
ncbi:MAG: hypothetical protein HYX78_06555 [Armatimonadetes bacterium]|nr:hypothetical protein [Armatimonadota bacterium]